RTPKKSSSFLSLRREKDRSVSQTNVEPAPPPLPGTSSSQYMQSTSYLDQYSRPKSSPSSRSSKGKSKSSPSPRVIPPPLQPPHDVYDRPSSSKGDDFAFTFPTFDSSEDLTTPTASSHTYVRARSRTGPSGRSHWDDVLSASHLRFSGSSSTQYTETTLHTPIDYAASRESFEQFPVVVAAPVAGVDVMDALVDGMNGGDMQGGSLSRARFGIPNHHPLYQPPLPTPPPGIVLGGGKPRRTKLKQTERHSSDSSDGGDQPRNMSGTARKGRKRSRPPSSRTVSNATITPASPAPFPNSGDEKASTTNYNRRVKNEIFRASSAASLPERPSKTAVPSISDIIRTYGPKEAHARPPPTRSASLYTPSQSHTSTREEQVETPSPQTEEGEAISRSSLDSIADEVRQTLKNQAKMKPISSVPPSSFPKRHSTISDNASIYSPRSDPGGPTPSLYSSSASYYQPASPYEASFLSTASPSQAVAQYLRSARLTTLLKLTRSPHASADNPLTVSLSDLGSRTGYPIVVFLGLGCVRHVMGLYDEMAECMGLRLITIDRWGLGRTEPRNKTARGIMQWADVVDEVLDLMNIDMCSIMAHSAGAPYALSFANKFAHRIHGDVCLLAPWVGGSESSGYKWLKYVPNGILKTAQAAEWRVQAWMIGKPPTIAYEGIGYTAPKDSKQAVNLNAIDPLGAEGLSRPRPSIGSSNGTFSEYDDLRDFEGRFESQSTLGADSNDGKSNTAKRKGSRGFIERFKTPQDDGQQTGGVSGKKLKGLRSLGSLKGKGRNASGKSGPPSPIPSLQLDIELGLDSDYSWTKSIETTSQRGGGGQPRHSTTSQYTRSNGHRSISFSSPKAPMSMPSSPVPSTANSTFTASVGPSGSYQAALGNALIAASHAESAKGTHNDLLQILNHDNHPWGFSYPNYPHTVKVWYGDKDEKIAENAVRWMERTMGFDKCAVKVVKGADHGLMYRSSVVIEVFERILSEWRS
ncbi:hypothetical protein P691DRAFT_641280, partial [Macrolepiota fuliginosa MF-IS2]